MEKLSVALDVCSGGDVVVEVDVEESGSLLDVMV